MTETNTVKRIDLLGLNGYVAQFFKEKHPTERDKKKHLGLSQVFLNTRKLILLRSAISKAFTTGRPDITAQPETQ